MTENLEDPIGFAAIITVIGSVIFSWVATRAKKHEIEEVEAGIKFVRMMSLCVATAYFAYRTKIGQPFLATYYYFGLEELIFWAITGGTLAFVLSLLEAILANEKARRSADRVLCMRCNN